MFHDFEVIILYNNSHSLAMKDSQIQEKIAVNQPMRKFRPPKIINRQSSPFEAKHNSLRKLMELRVLPPLHPQTDVKRAIQQPRHHCPEEFQQNSKDVSAFLQGKSEQLLRETPKFYFDNIVIRHLQKQSEQMMTISHDQQRNKRKQANLEMTFGKPTKRVETHRYTEMQQQMERDRPRKPLVDASNFTKLGKYDSIFKPYKESGKVENEVIKDHTLPPISSKHL